MIDFETLMFVFAFLPVILIVGLSVLAIVLKIVAWICDIILSITDKGTNESRDTRSFEENVSREASPNGNVQSNT